MEKRRRVPSTVFMILAVIVVIAFTRSGVAAANATWRYIEQSTTRADLAVNTVSADSSGFWLGGMLNGKAAVARYDNNAQLQWLRYAAFGVMITPLADGGFLTQQDEVDFYQTYCEVSRFAANGRLRWTQRLPTTCVLYGVDADGGSWVNSDALYRLAPDGTLRSVSASVRTDVGMVDTQTGTLYALAPVAAPQGEAIVSCNPDGSTRVFWQANDASEKIRFLTLGTDRNLYAIGTNATGLFSLSISVTGVTRWLNVVTPGIVDLGDRATFVSFPDGAVATLDASETLVTVGNDGSVRYSVSLGPTNACKGLCSNRLMVAGGDVVALLNDGHPRLERVDSIGHLLVDLTLSGDTASGLAMLGDGSALVGPSSSFADGGATEPLVRIDRSGNRLPVPEVKQIAAEDAELLSSIQSADGTLYLASWNSTSNRSWISKVSPGGQLLWRQQLDGTRILQGSLALNSHRLCWRGVMPLQLVIECRSTSDGTRLWTYADDWGTFALLDDDTVVALVTPLQANTHHVLLGADGQVLETTDLGRDLSSALPAFAKDGTVAVSDLQYGGAIFEWDKYGHALRAIPPPNADGFYLDSSITIDESDNLLVEAVFDASGQTYLWMLSSSGKTLWLRAVAASRLGPGNLANGYANVFIQRLPPASDSLVKYAIADGSSTEIFLNPGLSSYFYAPSIDAATGLLLFYDRFLFHQVSTLDPATGQLLRHVIPDCSPVSCDSDQPFSAALSVDGTLRTVGGELDPFVGAQIRVNAFAASNEPATAIRVDQPGLDGAWFPLDEGGQGFTLDYIASANTIFMPWFTYGLYADNDASGLAWYGLQGTVASGATKVDLVIAQTDPGAFNSGTVSGHAVGIAQLTFSDCDNGQLHYQFNADTNSGVEGLIGLTRLTPSTATCELADGTVAPAQNTNAPAQGFDARQSGSWFDPATSGQGLDLTIIPASNSSNGLVFAAWFAFDPAGNGDDPGNQHWFTLQGDLSAAAGGKVTLPIYRIIGGSLDNFPTSNYAEIGHATFTMLGCDSAQFDYQFDATEVAHAFAKLDGTMHLVKIGGCSQ